MKQIGSLLLLVVSIGNNLLASDIEMVTPSLVDVETSLTGERGVSMEVFK